MSASRYDFIVVGGGPAGLSAAISASRNGRSVLLLEQGEILGPRPRGEGVSHHRLFDDLLGEGFVQQHSYRTSHGVVYHSPGDLRQTALPSRRPAYFFEWRDFIDRLGEVAQVSGASIRTSCEVTGIVVARGRCIGVTYVDDGGERREARASAVLGCDGYRSVVGRHYGIDYDAVSCRIMKCRLSGTVSPSKALQFYLIGSGDLSYAPRFPPCVAYAFPLADHKMEVGLMLRMARARTMANVERPTEDSFVDVWARLKRSYPGFSRCFEGADIEHEEPTDLPNASLVLDNVPAPGAVLIGDSAGFIDPLGSSGIYSSMAMARLWTDSISQSMEYGPRQVWTGLNLARWRRRYYTSGIFRHIALSYLKVGTLEQYVFRHLGTAARINRRWDVIDRLLKLG